MCLCLNFDVCVCVFEKVTGCAYVGNFECVWVSECLYVLALVKLERCARLQLNRQSFAAVSSLLGEDRYPMLISFQTS